MGGSSITGAYNRFVRIENLLYLVLFEPQVNSEPEPLVSDDFGLREV